VRKIPPFLLLDAWRGIAALWVVMTHSCMAFLATGDNGHYLSSPLYIIGIKGQLGVVLFFVISGYCIMGAAHATLAAGRTAGRYGLDRFRRIYPPYLAAFIAAACVLFIMGFAQSHHLLPPGHHQLSPHVWREPLYWLANIFIVQEELGQPMPLLVFWSLCYEIVFYIMIGVLLLIAQACVRRSEGEKEAPVFLIGIGALTFLSLVWLIVSPATCPFPLNRWYQFGMGSLLFLMFAAKTDSSAWAARGMLILAGILSLLFALLHDASLGADRFRFFVVEEPTTNMQAVTGLLFVAILWMLRPYDEKLAHQRSLRPLMWLGTISYSLYLAHLLVLGFVDAGGRRLGFDHQRYWVTYLLEIAVAVVAGWLFFFFIERHFISTRQKRRVEVELSEPVN
jgi:exopolysaccharide production protein ExoZ